jgi:hypothetical protein
VAQRAFRQRKQKRIEELEERLTKMQQRYRCLEDANADLSKAYNTLVELFVTLELKNSIKSKAQ